LDNHLDALLLIGNSYDEFREKRGNKIDLVNFEIPPEVDFPTLVFLASKGVVHTMHEAFAEMTKDGIALSGSEPVVGVSWHLTKRGIDIVHEAVRRHRDH
jgi:hypothetical protein